jgi:23S rRNA (adenine2503-C2)-methyltransferase
MPRSRRSSRKPLFGLNLLALAGRMVEAGEPAWRGKQLAEALYRQRLGALDTITTLPKPLRQRLVAEGWEVGRPRIAQVFESVDGTERYLVESAGGDGQTVETVWMPEGDGGETGDGSEADGANGEREAGSAGSGLRFASLARWGARSTASSA